MSNSCSIHGNTKKSNKILTRKTYKKIPLRRYSHRREDNIIKMVVRVRTGIKR
jgi:hypothetical protein